MSVFHENMLLGAQQQVDYQISRSLRFNSADSAYLSRTPASAGNRKTWTWSGWLKRGALSATEAESTLFSGGGGANDSTIVFTGNQLFYYYYASPGGYLADVRSIAVFRDLSAWYHIVVAVDTTQATASNRVRLYVNGSEVSYSSPTYPSLSLDMGINTVSTVHTVGVRNTLFNYLSGYLADIHFIDGQALDPTSFGAFDSNNVWQPKAYTGTYGTNGFKLDFADNSSNTATTLGKDTSGNGNNWTPNNLSVTAGAGNDSLVDVPTNGTQTDTGVGGEVRGNYCTLNPLNLKANGALANGNLDWSTSAAYGHAVGTVGVSTGKWYCEFTVSAIGTGIGVGVTSPQTSASFLEGDALGIGYYSSNGSVYYSGGNAAYGTTFTTGDVIGVALDLDNGKLFFAKNGTWQNSGSPTTGTNAAKTGLSGTYTFGVNVITGAGSGVFNFGQRPFAYTAPSGFKALCAANLPTPTIANGATVMDVKLYTGNGSTQSITGLGFSPDLVWCKARSADQSYSLSDTVRGTASQLFSNRTDAETTLADVVTAFTSDGFNLGANATGFGGVNVNSTTYVAWCWDAGSSNVVNTQGTITSTVRANPSAGFSVVTWTSNGFNTPTQTKGHGLGVAPSLIILKNRSFADNWWVYHSPTAAQLFLNTTAAAGTGGGFTVSSTTFGNTESNIAFNGNLCVAYCFAPVSGYSSFGSYTGNGSADGPFVYTGFRPRWIMVKNATTAGTNWLLHDTARSNGNVSNAELYPNLSYAEQAYSTFDILSNGFKVRDNSFGNANTNGATHVYAAFAENPFSISRAR